MRKITGIIFLLLVVTIVYTLSECNEYPLDLTKEKASEIAHSYFQKTYNMNIDLVNVEKRQVSQKQYFNFISVSYCGKDYELVLDERNKPLTDNVSCLRKIADANLSSLENKTKLLGLSGFSDLDAYFSYQEKRYIVQATTATVGIPNKDSKDGVYSLLEMLKDRGVDVLAIEVDTPDFLLPKIELGLGVHGIQLDAEFFNTNIDANNFEKQYYNFTNNVYWDEQKFNEKISELSEMGYNNACFFIKQYYDANTIEIMLYYESDVSIDDSKAAKLLQEMNDSYFRIRDKETKYTLLHIKT